MVAFFTDPVLLAVALATSLPFLSMAVILIFTRGHQPGKFVLHRSPCVVECDQQI